MNCLKAGKATSLREDPLTVYRMS